MRIIRIYLSLIMNMQKILHENGLKTTPARIAVLDLLEKQNNPTDVFSIVEKLENQVDQATVYRILEILTEKKIINRFEFGEGKYRYEFQKNHHHHLICTSCAKIEDVGGENLNEIETRIKI